MFSGSIVAIVTPFSEGMIDRERFRALVDWHIEQGTDAIVVCGTTGEAATMTHEEHEGLIDFAVEAVDHRRPLMAGTGSNSTAEALRLTTYAAKAGADGALLVTPYYNKPTPRGQIEHFTTVAAAVDIPIILYNVPSRTGTNMLPSTVGELAKVDNIIGIKEATGDMKQCSQIRELAGEDFLLISGDDFTVFPLLSIGGVGVISVVANIAPAWMHQMIERFRQGDIAGARELHYRLFPLMRAMFIETNPIPVKTALAMMGRVEEQWRLPLCAMAPENREKLRLILEQAGLIR